MIKPGIIAVFVLSALFSVVFGLEQVTYAATINAASCSRTDVLDAITAAADGDRVLVPAGTCTWTSRITVSGKGITLAGAGINRTTIVNGTNSTALEFNFTPGERTTQVEGFTFNANNVSGSDAMILLIGGGLNQFRIHHFSMTNLRDRGIEVFMAGMEVSGLIDHGTFNMPIATGGSKAISISGTGPEESQPFSRPLALGSGKFIFIEDCTFNYGGRNDGALDAYAGARYVFRHNTVNNTNVEHHGADSGGFRGVHSFEIYNNAFRCTGACASQRKHYFRSGTGVIFNNTYSGNYDGAELTNYRSDESFAPWGKCDGTSPWDQNKPGQNGYACLDQIGHVFGPTPGGANIVEPLYEWNNTHDGADVDLFVGTAHANADRHIVQGRDFFNDTPRPGYTPYVYPHPLQGGSQVPPPAPTSLKVQ
jgi:hypothetical protein